LENKNYVINLRIKQWNTVIILNRTTKKMENIEEWNSAVIKH